MKQLLIIGLFNLLFNNYSIVNAQDIKFINSKWILLSNDSLNDFKKQDTLHFIKFNYFNNDSIKKESYTIYLVIEKFLIGHQSSSDINQEGFQKFIYFQRKKRYGFIDSKDDYLEYGKWRVKNSKSNKNIFFKYKEVDTKSKKQTTYRIITLTKDKMILVK